ncbi:MAG: hypothetical protein M3Z03_07945, partial [Actinomycetota bacterium]|nr:hypothetical protein [Actinomycetota bacterium]
SDDVADIRVFGPLGAQFLRWEFATAVAGRVLEINPFDQPNVQESKDNTVRLLAEHAANGVLPDEGGKLDATAPGFPARLLRHLRSTKRGDYVALTAYFHRTPRREKLLRDLQAAIRDRFRSATTVGYGPRFLHSTGQLHKGGPDAIVCVQVHADDAEDIDIPGRGFGFGHLLAAQAAGDLHTLRGRGRRAGRVTMAELRTIAGAPG